jgi:4-amino-4-deoxy-L-arabinose transferase-like glycosyltransferase
MVRPRRSTIRPLASVTVGATTVDTFRANNARRTNVHDVARFDRRFLLGLGALSVVGVGIRMLEVALTQWNVRLGGDAGWYHSQAELIVHGHWFVAPYDFAYSLGTKAVPSAAHPPLFTLVNVFAREIHLGGSNATRLVCCVIGGIGIFMVGLLGREVGGSRVGLLAGGIAAMYPLWWFTDGTVMSEVLYMPLVAGLLVLAYRLARRPRLATAVAMGAVGGLAAMTRSEGLLLVALVVIAVALKVRGQRAAFRVALAGTALAATAVVIAPWVVYNQVRFRDTVFLSTNAGDLADANCHATYYGSSLGGWVFNCHTPFRQHGDASQVSHQLSHVGIRYAEDHIGRVPVVVAARVGRMWGLFRPVQTLQRDATTKWTLTDSKVILATYYVLAAGAIVGFVVLWRRRTLLAPLVAALAALTITAATSYGFMRLRAPGDAVIVVLSAAALDAAIRALTGRRATGDVAAARPPAVGVRSTA